MSAGHDDEQCEGAKTWAPHKEEEPEPPNLPTGQDMRSGAVDRKQEEERDSECPHKKTSEIWQPSLLDPRTRQEMMSPEQCLRRSLPRSISFCPARRGKTRHPGPFYFFGGANGADIVSSYFASRGWVRIFDKDREDFKLKWCEIKSSSHYSNFRQGEQLVFQVPNNKVLTTKIGLLCSLREYERVSSKIQHGLDVRRLKMEEFIPVTYRMDIREEREAFFSQQAGPNNNQRLVWICKPSSLNQGRGIFLLKTLEDVSAFRHKLQKALAVHATRHHNRPPQAHIVQRYIQNPLLLKGRKFDVRSYLIIACTTPYMVFFRHGYVRLTCDLYDLNTNNMSAHLTNQYMQKKNPLYSLLKEDTVWSMESFNAYVNDRFAAAKDLPRDWVLGLFTKRMQQIMTQCFLSVKAKLDCRLGFFDLIGCDFMIDEDFNVWLLEMNCNPALHTNCSVLQEVIPSTVHETLDVTLEIFNKCRRGQRILPLTSQKDFVLLFKGVFPPNALLPGDKSRAPMACELSQKTSRKNQKEGATRWQSSQQSSFLKSSEKVLSGGERERTLHSSHKTRRKKVTPKLNTIQTTTVRSPEWTEEKPPACE